jgi:hypothetical protein
MKSATFLFCGFALLFGAQAHAQVYKCVDAKGKTVYSQSPCPANTKSKTLEANPTPPAPASAAAPSSSAPAKGPADPRKADAEFKKRQLEEQEAKKKAAASNEETKAKQENCGRAKGSLAQYEAGGRITRYNPKGEREFLTDEEIAREKARAQDLVQQYCK